MKRKNRSVSNSVKNKTKKTRSDVRLDPFYKKRKNEYPSSSWVVYTTPEGRDGKRSKPRVMDGSFTRDQVRGAYAAQMGVSKEETRSRRVSNY
jgi:hypothetical protein